MKKKWLKERINSDQSLGNGTSDIVNDLDEKRPRKSTPLIPSMDDKYENVKAKIATMKNKILADLNGVRQDLNLPQLDQDTLLDSKKRLALYEQVQSLPEGNKQKTPQL